MPGSGIVGPNFFNYVNGLYNRGDNSSRRGAGSGAAEGPPQPPQPPVIQRGKADAFAQQGSTVPKGPGQNPRPTATASPFGPDPQGSSGKGASATEGGLKNSAAAQTHTRGF